LPPDPARLRAILRHVEVQIAENETVHTYLDIQRNRILDALRTAEGTTARRRPEEAPGPRPPERRSAPSSTGFTLGRTRSPDGPVPASVHTSGCKFAGPLTVAMSAMDARVALVDGQLEVCDFCRPDTELGTDFDT
jgi:hypothetical protein